MKKGALGLVLITFFSGWASVYAYSNNHASLLRSHNSEFENLIKALDVHVNFFDQLLGSNHQDLSSWFIDSGEQAREQLRSRIEKIKNAKHYSLNKDTQSDLIDIITWLDAQSQTKSISYQWDNHQPIRNKIEKIDRFFDVNPLLSLFDVCGWLFDMGKQIFNNQLPIQKELFDCLRQFPYQEIAAKLGSITLRTALLSVESSGGFGPLIQCWQALRLLSNGQTHHFDSVFALDIGSDSLLLVEKMSSAALIVKEFSQLMHIFYVFFTEHCLRSSPEFYGNRGWLDYFQSLLPTEQNSAIQLITIYDEVSTLPIDQTLNTMSRLVREFTRMIGRLQKNHGLQWLPKIPFVAGIVIVKIIQYFLPLNNHTGSYTSNYGSYGGYNEKPGGYDSGYSSGGGNNLHDLLHNSREK